MSSNPIRLFVPALCVALGIVFVLGAGTAPLDPAGAAPAIGAQEYPQPGPEHKWIAERVGSWNAHCKMKMLPEAPWTEFPATETCTVVLGGFWLQADFRCDYQGMNFQGRNMLGYDQHKKKYISTWQDSTSSGITILEGTYDAAKKVMLLEGEGFQPDLGKVVKQRSEIHFKDDGTSVMKMFLPGPDGKEFQNMEIAYTKAASKPTSKPVR